MSDYLLENFMSRVAEDALAAINDDSEHTVWLGNGQKHRYIVCEEVPEDRSVILEREEDGKRFRVIWSVSVKEEA
jgi:hypothetical protein